MNLIFEKYFLGEMNAAETANLEQELAENPALREQFEQEKAFFEMLKNQMLRRKIEAALREPDGLPTPKPKNPPRKIWLWLALSSFALLTALFLRRHFSAPTGSGVLPEALPKNPNSQPPADTFPFPKIENPSPGNLPPEKLPTQTGKPSEKMPIAQAVEPHSLENFRGANSAKTPWADLVEKIWFAPLPVAPEKVASAFLPAVELLSKNDHAEAFRQLRKLENSGLAANDTLVFLKGYCLMQLWEGHAAQRNFERLAAKPNAWQADLAWYAGLCHLLAGEKRAAVLVFEKIAGQVGHRYRFEAERALELLI